MALVLRSNDDLARLLKHCCHCGIRFLADPRNGQREGLRCPFGCAKHYRAQQSAQRAKAYRQTEVGRKKKEALNAQRYRAPAPDPPTYAAQREERTMAAGGVDSVTDELTATAPAEATRPLRPEARPEQPAAALQREPAPQPERSSPSASTPPPPLKLELHLGEIVLDETSVSESPMLPYIRELFWVIDGVRLRPAEVVEYLRQALRQHSMAYQRRRDYVLRFLHQHPP